MDCTICGEVLDPVLAPVGCHPLCARPGDEVGARIKAELIDVIRWADSQSLRSQQVMPGPSEIGDPCDRRLGYRIAGVTPPGAGDGRRDPWAAVVGTAIHAWMERAVSSAQAALGEDRYLVEERVMPDAMIAGKCDLYHVPLRAVIDYKGAGPTVMKTLSGGAPPSARYRTQVQLYGLGHVRAGRPVDWVCLFFLPRAGHLKDAVAWVEPFDATVAQGALDRVYRIADQLIDLDVERRPGAWAELSAEPEKGSCFTCPMWSRAHVGMSGATVDGCPGV